jgi:hypothetical protein
VAAGPDENEFEVSLKLASGRETGREIQALISLTIPAVLFAHISF